MVNRGQTQSHDCTPSVLPYPPPMAIVVNRRSRVLFFLIPTLLIDFIRGYSNAVALGQHPCHYAKLSATQKNDELFVAAPARVDSVLLARTQTPFMYIAK
jgi:hypothetical protein